MSPSTPRRHYDDHIYLRQFELAELQQDLDDELDRKVEIERRLDELGAGEDLALNGLSFDKFVSDRRGSHRIPLQCSSCNFSRSPRS